MDSATLEELRALRARAYGPSADIHDDPAALQRLHELEARSSGAAAAQPVAGDEPLSTPVASAAPVVPSSTAQPAVPASERPEPTVPPPSSAVPSAPAAGPATSLTEAGAFDGTSAASKRRRRRTIGALWVISLIAVAALAASATYGLTRLEPVSVSSGAEQIATLEPVDGVAVPSGWFGAGPSSAVFEFYGLTLFQSAYGSGAPGTDCITIIPTDQLPEEDADPNDWTVNGMMYSGCQVGDFPATVEMPVDSTAPKELTERYPIGSALQFVFVEDRVGVFLDEE